MRLVGAVAPRQKSPTSSKKAMHGAAAVARQLAADEIQRLDAVGAFVDHGDAGIAHELLMPYSSM